MAVQRPALSTVHDANRPLDPLLQRAEVILSERGVSPDENGMYKDADLIAALRDRGWDVEEWPVAGGRRVNVVDRSEPLSRIIVESDETRPVLLEALRRSMSWQTADEDERSFDNETRALLGISSDEFQRRWRDGRLDFNDPIVEHLGVSLPSGR